MPFKSNHKTEKTVYLYTNQQNINLLFIISTQADKRTNGQCDMTQNKDRFDKTDLLDPFSRGDPLPANNSFLPVDYTPVALPIRNLDDVQGVRGVPHP
jgi:hypothetical protein